jgi:subtilisin-like proprotein convertase family protein
MNPTHTPCLNWLAAFVLAVTLIACPNQPTPKPPPPPTPVDTTPNPVTFAPVNDVNLSAVTESNPVTISGINTAVAVSVTGGEYKIGDAGTYKNTPSTIKTGEKLQLRTTAASTLNTAKDVSVTVGTSAFTFTVTTKKTAGDISFATKIDQPWATTVESNSVTLSGINPNTPISVTGAGGSYKINALAYTTTAGTVKDGDTVTVKGNTASADLTDTLVTLTVGGQARTFTLRTGKRIPDAFSPALSNQTEAEPNSSITRGFTVSGITIPSPITVTGGTFTINGVAASSPAVVNNNDALSVTVTAPSTADGSSSPPANITVGRDALNPSGGLAGVFTVSTKDWNPEISFSNLTGAAPNISDGERYWTGTTRCTIYPPAPNTNCPGLSGDPRYQQPPLPSTPTFTESNTVTLGSISVNTPISVIDGEYSLNGAAYSSTPGTVNPGDTVRVRLSAIYPGSSYKATLTFGTPPTSSFAAAFNVTTSSAAIQNVWTANAATAPIPIPSGATASSSITVPTTTAKIAKVRVLVTLSGSAIRRSAYVIRLVPPAASGGATLKLMDFISAKDASGTANTSSYLSAGKNPLDPRNVGASNAFPPIPADALIDVPLAAGTAQQRPWPWNNLGFFDGGWGGPVDTIFDSSKFGTDGTQSTYPGDWRMGLGTDTYVDGGINRNDVYRRCGTDFYQVNKGQYTAAQLQAGQTPTQIDDLNTALNRDLPRNLNRLPENADGVKIDPYTGIKDNRVQINGEYTDGQCKRKDGDTFYPPVAPDPRVGDLSALNTKNPTGTWTLEVQQTEAGSAPITITAFKLIFDFAP